jgi:TatD DNase family protein
MDSERLLDAHCHISSPKIDEKRRIEWLTQAQGLGVFDFFLGGVDPDDWQAQLEFKSRYESGALSPSLLPGKVLLSFGIHPWTVAEHFEHATKKMIDPQTDLDAQFKTLTEKLESADAVGEIGLDFSKRFSAQSHPLQREYFKKQLALAVSIQKPVVLHLVSAHSDALQIIDAFDAPTTQEKQPQKQKIRGIIHRFNGSLETANAYLARGFLISMSPQLLGEGFKGLKSAVKDLDCNGIVFETDGPSYSHTDPSVKSGPTLIDVAEGFRNLRHPEMDNNPAFTEVGSALQLLHESSLRIRRLTARSLQSRGSD